MREKSLMMLAALAALVLGAFTTTAWINRKEPTSLPDTSRDKGGEAWGADYFPNVLLTTHDGQKVRFFDDLIKGKVVGINFIYTTCPDACPIETARLLEVSQLLGERMGKDVFFYSITIDPEHDTQPVLAEFAASWGIGPGWKFLTGTEAGITAVRKKLGVWAEEASSKKTRDHGLSLVLGNQATGRWMRRSPFESAHVLADQLGSWLHNWKSASKEKRDYADAPELRPLLNGEMLFRTRCASCHTIGGGDVDAVAERRIGPDLLDVGRQREREWLIRWIAEPDKMIEEKDPLALALLAQYKNVPMPNLRLSRADVEKLLGFIDQESRRVHSSHEHDEHAHHQR